MRKKINRITMTFPSKSVNEGFSRAAAAAVAAQLDPTIDELGDLKTAVSEAVTNAIVHGYREKIGSIHMSVTLFDPPAVEVVVRDKGCGIADVETARTPMFTTGGPERSGMGFTIMETFCEKIRVTSAPGKGTTVKLFKTFTPRET